MVDHRDGGGSVHGHGLRTMASIQDPSISNCTDITGTASTTLFLAHSLLYLFFFWIHFTVLIQSGPGDAFMSPQFQQTLRNNEMLMNSQGEFSLAFGWGPSPEADRNS